MSKLAVLIFQTLDGVMQSPSNPTEDFSRRFKHGGWAKEYWEEVMLQVQEEAMSEPYDLLLGRKTYELFSKHNSQSNSPLNDMVKYVVTSTISDLNWKNSLPISGDVIQKIVDLKSQNNRLIQVHGSWQLIQSLLENDLIDEFRLWTFPVISGSGKRLFEKNVFKKLELKKSIATSSGVIMSFYRKPKTL